MILNSGDKVLLYHRRLFEQDDPRFFTGFVETYEDGIVRVKGQAWQRSAKDGSFRPKTDLRVKVQSLSTGGLMVYVLPHECELEAITLRAAPDRGVVITDGGALEMEVTERLG